MSFCLLLIDEKFDTLDVLTVKDEDIALVSQGGLTGIWSSFYYHCRRSHQQY
jgi:hypothetical protein